MKPVTYARDGALAIITVDNPPVNALGQAVRQGLVEAIAQFDADDAVAAVLCGAGSLFIGGADIREFGKTPTEPYLPDVVNRIEAATKPVVAALHGVSLGGGAEVALACHYRVADPQAQMGFPEVKLGLIPGAGGTQRAPRLAGVAPVIDLVTKGAPIGANRAQELGLVDEVSADVMAAAKAFAHKVAGQAPRRVGALPRPDKPADLEALRAAVAKAQKGEVAPLAACDAVIAACDTDLIDGMAIERGLFMDMMETPQRAGLIHAFFNDRKVSKLPELAGVAPRAFDQVGVIGGGLMGSGIATAALLRGLSVKIVERDAAAADKARATVTHNLDGAVKRGKMSDAKRDAILSDQLDCVVGYDALADADLIIEAVFENLDVKREVFAELDRVAKPGAILATNTSYLDVDAIAAATSRPQDVIGLHFFSPAHIMKLLEVVVADQTAPDVVATAFALAKRMGKVAVRAGVCDGFIGNRILQRIRMAADNMVLDGADPYEIDGVIRAFGFAMGPFQVSDLAGLDIAAANRARKSDTRDPRERVPHHADMLVEAGRIGQKSGRGYYTYDPAKRGGQPDPELGEVLDRARTKAGTAPRVFDAAEIERRYLAAMVNEAAKIVDEGIAARPLDVDVTLLYGYGFPRWRGGPMKWADMLGLDVLLADIKRYAQEDPYFWQPSALLERLASEGRSFDSLN